MAASRGWDTVRWWRVGGSVAGILVIIAGLMLVGVPWLPWRKRARPASDDGRA